ncbi:MAG: class I SAM-dependent methyltransferase [Betaproteobacteria bacterium]|nr:class I SAM-dependent methyltransferase [Betaproteobacteria bacterium]
MSVNHMEMMRPGPVCQEREIYERLLPLEDARIIELGCGKAEKTQMIAKTVRVAQIVALEVDAIQHSKNQLLERLPNVRFALGGAQAIPAADESFDIVLMFKSLHHVPMDQMEKALSEIRRVLRPGGLAYISEPVYAGAFNDILRLFHDERVVREAAFNAVRHAVSARVLDLARQEFFSTPMHFDNFEHFEADVIKVTHTHHDLSPELLTEVRNRFIRHMTPNGADFLMPIRVDLLRKRSCAPRCTDCVIA